MSWWSEMLGVWELPPRSYSFTSSYLEKNTEEIMLAQSVNEKNDPK